MGISAAGCHILQCLAMSWVAPCHEQADSWMLPALPCLSCWKNAAGNARRLSVQFLGAVGTGRMKQSSRQALSCMAAGSAGSAGRAGSAGSAGRAGSAGSRAHCQLLRCGNLILLLHGMQLLQSVNTPTACMRAGTGVASAAALTQMRSLVSCKHPQHAQQASIVGIQSTRAAPYRTLPHNTVPCCTA